jgi:hypothetical protein
MFWAPLLPGMCLIGPFFKAWSSGKVTVQGIVKFKLSIQLILLVTIKISALNEGSAEEYFP